MLNNFIYAKTKGLFIEQLEANQIIDEAIVFIEDTKEIWNHGTYFAGEGIDPDLFNAVQVEVALLKENKQDALVSGTNIKTLNGESIVGSGDLVVESSKKIKIVQHDVSETSLELTPGVLHKWDPNSPLTFLSFTLSGDTDDEVNIYKLVFTVGENFSISVPYHLKWENNTIPEFEEGTQCEINIEDNRIVCATFPLPSVEGEELLYIDNNGDHILTDILLDNNIYGVEYKVAPLFGADSYDTFLSAAGTDTGVKYNGSTSSFNLKFNVDGDVDMIWNGVSESLGTYTNGVVQVYTHAGTQLTLTNSYPLMIFCFNNGGDVSNNWGNFRFYELKFKDVSGNVVIDLVPFKVKSTGVLGVMNKLSGVFYPSVNGNLTTFEGVEGEYLEYVENDGVDYVLTDYNMTGNEYGIRYKAAPLFNMGQSTNMAIAGTRDVNASTSDTPFFMWYLANQQGRMLYWNGTSKTSFGEFTNGTAYEDQWTGERNTVTSKYPLIVFGGNNAGTPAYNNIFRFYYLEFLENSGNSIFKLRPFRKTDGTIGLKDEISGMFYPSVNGNLIGN